ncbi:MAG: pirin family protein [Hyphomicrobiales bacterium]
MTNSNKNKPREIVKHIRGKAHGPITRLMSPSDLGETLKPFVFLDLIDAQGPSLQALEGMPLHPHSGIATVTVFTKGGLHFDDLESGTGMIGYGGVEWLRAGNGVWHGKEMSLGDVQHLSGFQLWLSLPPELENGSPQSRYIEAKDMRSVGPAHIIIGEYENVQSLVPAPEGINYLMVTLQPGEEWRYMPSEGHTVGWLAVASGSLDVGEAINEGEMVVFESDEEPIVIKATGDQGVDFVLGSAVPHPHTLHLGSYSVHTSTEALVAGEKRIAELGRKLKEEGDRRTSSGSIPVFR